MALPVANLGYMPNLGAPGRGPTTVIEDPWTQLAQQVLTAAVQQGISNSFEKDYTKQAQNEGLAVDPAAKAAKWYQKPFTGATTDKSQLKELRSEQGQLTRSAMAEQGATGRAAMSEKGQEKRQVSGQQFQGGENQQSRNLQEVLQNRELGFRSAEGGADRTARSADAAMQNTAAMERLDKEIAAQEAQLGRRLSSDEKQVVMREFIDQMGKITMNATSPASAIMANQLGMPAPDASKQIDALAAELAKLGYSVAPMKP